MRNWECHHALFKDCRARKAAKHEPAKKAGSRITRLLVDHPETLAKFEAFMLQIGRSKTVASLLDKSYWSCPQRQRTDPHHDLKWEGSD